MNAEPKLDLSELDFLPAWAKETPQPDRYRKWEGESPARERQPGAPRRDRRDQKEFKSQRRPEKKGRPPFRSHRPEEPAAPPAPAYLKIEIEPETHGLESLIQQIRSAHKAYPLFEIAHMILRKPERFHIQVTLDLKKADPGLTQIFQCKFDETVWLSETAAIEHVLQHRLTDYYREEKVQGEPPKGNFTSVAIHEPSGVNLGPTSHHDYPQQLRKLHREKAPHQSLDQFQQRIRLVRDEAKIQEWRDQQSWKTTYYALHGEAGQPLNTPDLPAHFRDHHLADAVNCGSSFVLTSLSSRETSAEPVVQAIRAHLREQSRFPLQLVTVLSQRFGKKGLRFFKVKKTTFVSGISPKPIPDTSAISESIRRIIDHLRAHPGQNRQQILAGLVGEKSGNQLTSDEGIVLRDLHWLILQGHVIDFSDGRLELSA